MPKEPMRTPTAPAASTIMQKDDFRHDRYLECLSKPDSDLGMLHPIP